MTGIAFIQTVIVLGLSVVAFGVEVFALVDAARTRPDAFVATGKMTKNRWLLILSLAAVFGFLALPAGAGLSVFNLLPLVGVMAAGVYLADVRPAVRQIRGGGGKGRNPGPYGPW